MEQPSSSDSPLAAKKGKGEKDKKEKEKDKKDQKGKDKAGTGEKDPPNTPFNVTSKVWIPQTTKGRSSILGARPSVY